MNRVARPDSPAGGRTRFRRLALHVGAVCLGLALAWAGGLVGFVAMIPSEAGDVTTTTDAIVVLTGGSERLEEGLRLLANGQAQKLLISGVHQEVDLDELLHSLPAQEPAIAADEAACCIRLGHSADNTAGNAREAAEWMAAERFASLRLVTGAYHMPRSLLEFRRAMPGMAIVPNPVFPPKVKRDAWWRWPGTTSLLIREYHKFLVAVLRGLTV